jgi:hypothetical protein
MKNFILKEFGYNSKVIKSLNEEENRQLYLAVMQYVWANLFNDLPKSKVEEIRRAIDNNKINDLPIIVPNFIELVKIYGRKFRKSNKSPK